MTNEQQTSKYEGIYEKIDQQEITEEDLRLLRLARRRKAREEEHGN